MLCSNGLEFGETTQGVGCKMKPTTDQLQYVVYF